MRLVLSVYITVTVNTGHSWTIMQTMIAFSFLTVVPQGFIIILYFLSFLFVWFSVCLLWIRPQTLHHVSKSSLRHSDAQTFHWFQPSERASSPGGLWLVPWALVAAHPLPWPPAWHTAVSPGSPFTTIPVLPFTAPWVWAISSFSCLPVSLLFHVGETHLTVTYQAGLKTFSFCSLTSLIVWLI